MARSNRGDCRDYSNNPLFGFLLYLLDQVSRPNAQVQQFANVMSQSHARQEIQSSSVKFARE